jgi:RNA polymerase sigma factor (sigma-70 family)
MSAVEAGSLFIRELGSIERISTYVAIDNKLRGADVEDFVATIKLKLIEDDYRVIRAWTGRSTLTTYLMTVINHVAADQHVRQLGKWRPTVAAETAGPHAILLERLLHRDRLSFEEAVRRVGLDFPSVTVDELERISGGLRQRAMRASIDFASEICDVAVDDSAEDRLLGKERDGIAQRISNILSEELKRCSAEERLLVKWHFQDRHKVATIARMLNVAQMPLYRRLHRLLDQLREALTREGVSDHDAHDLVAHGSDELQIAFDEVLQRSAVNGSMAGERDDATR